MLSAALRSAKRRTSRSLLVKPPSRKTGWEKRLVVTMGTPRPVSSSALRREPSAASFAPASASKANTSLSWKVMPCLVWKVVPEAPRPPSRCTAYAGSIGGRIAPPNTSTPCQPTVHSPKENLSAAVGVKSGIGIPLGGELVVLRSGQRHQIVTIFPHIPTNLPIQGLGSVTIAG